MLTQTWKAFRLGALFVSLGALGVGCYTANETQSKEGQSHWLERCSSQADCSAEHICACGVCTIPCEVGVACGVNASCEPTAQCEDAPSQVASVCLRAADDAFLRQDAGDESVGPVDSGPIVVSPTVDGSAADVMEMPVELFEPIAVQSEVSSEYATINDDIVILWRTFDPSQQYFGQRMTIEGGLDRFRVVLPDEPPVEGRYQPQDAETGLEPADAPWIAAGSIYRVVGGKLESNPNGVDALDTDTVIGQTRGVIVWTPVELAPGWHLETKGIAHSSDEPLSPGYHLFVDFVEVDLGTLLILSNRIWT